MNKNQAKPEKKNENLQNPENKKAPQGNEKEQIKSENIQSKTDNRLIELEKEAAEMRDKFMRTYAEMENIKKRCQNEIEKNAKIAIADFALSLLPVADNLERALSQEIPAELSENVFIKNLLTGVQMTQKQLNDAFVKNGLKYKAHTLIDSNKLYNTV
jgi:molecular chaperone GrpE